MKLDEAIKSRKSVRKFSSKKPDWREIIECVDAARFAPMAGGNYSVKFILVDDKSKIEKLGEAAQQDFIKTAHYIVVACSNPKRTVNAYGERGKRYLRQQAGAAMENFLLKMQEKKLATCWVGHFVDKQVKEILDIHGDIEVEALFPIGYEYKKSKTHKAPIDLDNILYFNKYKQKKMKRPKMSEGRYVGKKEDSEED